MTNPVWIIGCGDIGRRVAKLYPEKNISGIVQSERSAKICSSQGIQAHQINADTRYSLPLEAFNDALVYYFVPPPSQGVIDTRLQNFLDQVQNKPQRIVLISTTGVYGDSGGHWIDESTPVNPVAERAQRRLSAEQSLQAWAQANHRSYMILRVPGIYAQDRLPLARLQKGLAVVKEAEAGWTNRIHADDLAQACKSAMNSQHHNEIINITDGNPSTMTDYFNQVADYAGLPRPPQISMQEAEATLSAGMVSYLRESRRIKNTKMLDLLNINLQYPNLAAALSRPE